MKKFLVLTLLLLSISRFVSADIDDNRFVVVIDAGHGGKDGGATRDKFKEKDINLAIATKLGQMIESNMKDVKIVYTRKSDTFVDLYKRAEIANKAKANLFISIHTNSTEAKTTTASGADTYILGLAKSDENLAVAKRENSVILLEDNHTKRYQNFDPNSTESYIIFEFMTNNYMEQSLQFATFVQNGFSNVARRVDRGVNQAGFIVLRESAMPSVLIEVGFINNPTEARYLTSDTGQRMVASAIYSGLDKFKRDFYKKQGQPVSANNATPPPPTQVVDVTSKPTSGYTAESKPVTAKPDNKTADKPVSKPTQQQTSPFIVKNNDPNKSIRATQSSPQNQSNDNKQANTKNTQPTDNKKNETVKPVTQPIENNKPKNTEVQAGNNNRDIPAGAIEYRIQFMTSGARLANNSPRFKGLTPVDVYNDGGSYKYTYGSTTNENEALRLQREVRKKFNDAFLIKFKNGVRIK